VSLKFFFQPSVLFSLPLRTMPWELTASVAELVAAVRLAEDVGFDYLCVNDHVAVTHESAAVVGTRWADPIATMAYLAAMTSRIRLYTSVLIVPYRPPLLVAKALATVDLFSGGRLTVGAGVGYLKSEFDALQVTFEQRGEITDEYLLALQQLWSADEASFHGKHVEFSNVCSDPRPVQQPHPPIIIGGNSPPAMRRAARLGDGWHPTMVEPADLPQRLDYIYNQPEFQARPRPFEVVVGLVRLKVDERTHVATGDTHIPKEQEVLEQVEILRQAGATAIWVTSFRSPSWSQYLEDIQAFGEQVIAKYRPGG
jgi:probable F420-dependent oxidoreductase